MYVSRKRFKLLSALTIAAAGLLLCLPAFAQVSSVSGKVLDPQGAVIPGVTVTMTSARGTQRTVVSNEVGIYQFLQVPPGTYTLKAELSGFKTAVIPNVELLVDTPRTLDIKMEIGELTETVTVEAGAIKLNTSDATLGNAFESKRIVELPLESRNVAGLLNLQPGVTQDGYVTGARSDQSNLTLDGIDVNEQQEGTAFLTVLRVNPDTVQEFRVTTATPLASQGRSSGGQVSLITKTGTNDVHGALYWYHRNTATTANDFFNNRSGIPVPKLLRNLFGGSVGGPIIKDRAFFFYNYEGRRDAKEESVLRTVPLASLGRGEVKYPNKSGGITTLTPDDINRIFPAVGVNPIAMAALADAAKRYPANDTGTGDGLNYSGFRFNAPLPLSYNAHTANFSFNLDPQARHVLTIRGNYQHDTEKTAPQFPDTPAPAVWSHPIGIAATHTWTINPKLVNTFRFGLTRQAFSRQGDSSDNAISFRFIFSPRLFQRTQSRVTPVYNLVDDLAWVNGNHTWQFGANIRLIDNRTTRFTSSYDTAITNPSFYELSGAVLTNPLTDLAGNRAGAQAGLTAVIGRYSQYTARFNFDRDGKLLAPGTGVDRIFSTDEYEFYAQDMWRVRPDLTVTLGMRYSLYTPVNESSGYQVKPSVSLGQLFELRKSYAARGVPYNEIFSVDKAGPYYGRPGYYELDKNNFSPRAAFAWSPSFENGFLKKIFGTGQKSVFRGGFAMAYDRVGSALAVNFDVSNTLGFSSNDTIAANTYNVTTRPAPLFTGFKQDIRSLPNLRIPDKLVFPQTKPADEAQRIEQALDDSIITPPNYTWNFSIARELPKSITVEASYLGRVARNLLANRDIMALNDLVDPKSGVDWYTAMGSLVELRNKGTAISAIPRIPYFENLFPLLPQWVEDTSLTASQAAYMTIARPEVGGWDIYDYTYVQLLWDDGLGYGNNLFFHPQYAALACWSTVGYSDYHAATLSIKQRLSSLNWDLNYTFGKSTDIGSGLQNEGGYGAAFITNPLRPKDMHAVSDFDLTHIVNFNGVWTLPFGRGRTYLSSINPALDAILGGWQFGSIFRWNSGEPVNPPFDAQFWATNWNVQSNAFRIRDPKVSPTKKGAHPNFFADPTYAYQSFRNAKPGETGDRNIFRRSPYVALDFALVKSFRMPRSENHKLTFRWDVFNATNTQMLAGPTFSRSGMGVDIDPWRGGTPSPDFGKINSIQGAPRVMQFALRYEF